MSVGRIVISVLGSRTAQYVVRRILLGAVTLLLVTFLIYGLIRNMPGDPLMVQISKMAPGKSLSKEDIERQRRIYGLDKHWTVAYGLWLRKAVRGDFGTSFSRRRPVADVVRERIFPTLLMTGTSLILTYLISIPVGLYCTVRAGKLDERLTSVGLYTLYSLPSYVAALFLQILFALKLNGTFLELPLDGMVDRDHDSYTFVGQILDYARHALLPVVCYTYGSLAYYSRFIRANMQEVIRQDYIRTARAKGLGPLRVLLQHAFRNTLIPLVTMIGLTLPFLLSGAIILETIFTWPGIGRLFILSVTERDYPTIMALTLMFSALTLLGQLLADLLYAFVDPRITYR